MITLTREEAQQMLDALEKISMGGHPDWANDVTPILRTRLAQPEPEPTKLLLIPALMEQAGWVRKREWQGLTEDEIMEMCVSAGFGRGSMRFNLIVQAIEAKLKGKNI